MIGKAYVSVFKYYDLKTSKMAFKKRPVLVIGEADQSDYVVLPISRVTRKENLHPYYDFEVKKEEYGLLNLTQTSYVRTHKQSVIHEGELVKEIVDMKQSYPDAYREIIRRVGEFQRDLIEKA